MDIEKLNNDIGLLRKRIIIPIVSIILLVTLLGVNYWWLNSIVKVNTDLLIGIYLIISMGFVFLLYYYKEKVSIYYNQYSYLLMVKDNLGYIPLKANVLDSVWDAKVIKLGFKLYEDSNFLKIYYTLSNQNQNYKNIKSTIIFLVILKTDKIDFYGSHIQAVIRSVMEQNESRNQIKGEIVLQFMDYDQTEADGISNAQKIINYKSNRYFIVHITAAILRHKNKWYYLRPIRRYPNRYYYESCQIMNQLCQLD